MPKTCAQVPDWTTAVAPTLADVEVIANAAYLTIPAQLRAQVDPVAILVVDFPDDETLDEMGCETAFDLLGLYQGVSLDRKSVTDTPRDVDRIFLYRRPLLDFWSESGEEFGHLVRHVLIHEIGHHFGYSDDDMEAIDNE